MTIKIVAIFTFFATVASLGLRHLPLMPTLLENNRQPLIVQGSVICNNNRANTGK